MNNILSIRDVSKSFKDKNREIKILNSVNLDIENGDFVSIVGKSGSGKTTLLNIIGLLDTADSGEIFFENKNLLKFTESQRNVFRNVNLGFIFQFHYLLKEFSVIENIMLPAYLKEKKFFKNIKERSEQILVDVGLKDRINYKVENLSGGEKQRVSIARALINSPKLILADEPTGNLDEETSEKITELFSYLSKVKKQTILVVTHSKELANITTKTYKVKNYSLTKI